MCTNIYDTDGYICATEVNSYGDLTAWDYCDPCCPGKLNKKQKIKNKIIRFQYLNDF